MEKVDKTRDLNFAILILDIAAVFFLGLLALSWIYHIESIFLGAVLNLTTLPSVLIVPACFLYGLFILFTGKGKMKMSLSILFCSLAGIAAMVFMQLNFP
jgi:hypothetical protein